MSRTKRNARGHCTPMELPIASILRNQQAREKHPRDDAPAEPQTLNAIEQRDTQDSASATERDVLFRQRHRK